MKRCNFYLDDVDERLLKEASELYCLSRAAVLRLLIRKYLKVALEQAKAQQKGEAA